MEAAGGKSGQAFQSFTCRGGETFSVSGFVKSAGHPKVNVAVQAFDRKYTHNEFIQLKFVQDDTEWTAFTKQVTLPGWADHFNLLLMVDGPGKGWLDEVHESSSPVDPGEATDPLTTEPCPPGKPWDEGWGFYPQFPTAWQLRHQELLRRTATAREKHDLDVLFVGDSITQGWTSEGEGKPVWDKTWAPLKAANYGIGGDSTRQVLWRLNRGEVDGIAPKVIVLMIGTNNLYGDQNAGTEEEIARGIAAVADALRHKLPQSRILLLSILPRQNDFFCDRIRKINAITRKLDNGSTVRVLDMADQFQLAPGKVRPELFKNDQLHLVTKGYETWAQTMGPLLKQMMGD